MSLIHWWPLNGNTKDLGLFSNNILAAPSASMVSGGKIGAYSARFSSASTDYHILNDMMAVSPNALSIAGWVKLDSTQNGWGQICKIGPSGSSWNDIRFGLDNRPNTHVIFNVSDGTNSTSYNGPHSDTNLQDNKWHHLAATYDSGVMRMFVDGVETSSSPYTTTIVPKIDSSASWILAGSSETSSENPYLTFSSPNSFTLNTYDNAKHWDGTLEYSTDKSTWNTWNGTTVLSSGSDNKLYLRGTGNTVVTIGDSTGSGRFVLTGSNISCSGNIENLLDYQTVTLGNHPTMGNGCYQRMFKNCAALTTAPELPATTLTDGCYCEMFMDCTSLTTAPALPATTLTSSCYTGMFSGCTSLTTVPALPATTLAYWSYFAMFYGCTSLIVNNTSTSTATHEWRIPTSGTLTNSSTQELMFEGCAGTHSDMSGTAGQSYTYYTQNEPIVQNNIQNSGASNNAEFMIGNMNDFRIYDHALSTKEVKEISKGLVLHYNFEDAESNLLTGNFSLNTGTTIDNTTHPFPGHGPIYKLSQSGNTSNVYRGLAETVAGVKPGDIISLSCWIYTENKASLDSGAELRCYQTKSGGSTNWSGISWISSQIDGKWCYHSRQYTLDSDMTSTVFNANVVKNGTYWITGIKVEYGSMTTDWTGYKTTLSKVYDSSGYSNNGTVNGNLQISSDSISGQHSAVFGSGIYIETPSLPNFENATYSFWVKLNNADTAYRSIFIPKGSPTGNGIWLSANTESYGVWAYQGGNSPNYCGGNTPKFTANTWALYTYTFKNSVGQCYFNGEPTGNAVTYTTRNYITGGIYTIGDSYTGSSWSGPPFDGKIADFKIFATALSADDVKAEYNRKAAIDKNGNLFTGEIIETDSSATKIDKNNLVDSNLFATTMTLEDGSLWAPICVHYVPDGLNSANSNTFYYKSRNIWNNFGAINDLERPETGWYEFYVIHQQAVDGAWHWFRFKQNVNPIGATYAQTSYSNVGTNVIRIGTNSSWNSQAGGMYWYNSSNCPMCFPDGSNGDWWGCGIRANHQGGIPSYNIEVAKGWQLVYMRISKHQARLFKNGVVIPTSIKEL